MKLRTLAPDPTRHRSRHRRFRGFGLLEVLVGLTLVGFSATFLLQAVAASVRAERQARERLIAMQWLAGALDELRVTGKVSSPRPGALPGSRLTIMKRAAQMGPFAEVELTATWREPAGTQRTARVTGLLRRDG